MKTILPWAYIYQRIESIKEQYPLAKFYGIPRGGQIAAGLTGRATLDILEADVIIDDIKDSGKTEERYSVYGKPVVHLYTKDSTDGWITFPWELEDETKDKEDLVIRQIEALGEDITRDGLKDTGRRVIKSWAHLYSGYGINPKTLITAFEKDSYDQMIVLKNCEFYSTCEHHMLPFFGKIHIGYIPKNKVIGISKLARVAECFSRRLQIQERIGEQVTDFIMKELDALGCGCIIEAQHFCMMARGVEKQNSIMVTSSLKGRFRDEAVRTEFLSFIK